MAEKDAALAALGEKEALLGEKEAALAALKQHRDGCAGDTAEKAADVLAAMDANGGVLPVEALDGMSGKELDDMVSAAEAQGSREA